MDPNILVIGGAGMLGRPVARQFQREGWAVRIFTRDPAYAAKVVGDGFDLRAGDVEDPGSLDRALDGCDGVHINLQGGNTVKQLEAIEYRGVVNIVKAAARAKVRRLSYLSYAVDLEHYLDFPYAAVKHRAEQAILAGDVPYTLFRATHFMESLRLYFRDHQPILIGRQPHRYHWVAADDYARMVTTAYNLPEAAGKRFFVFGPEAMTMKEALLRYCTLLHRKTDITCIPLWAMRLMGYLVFDRRIRFVADLMEFFSQAGEMGDPTEANRLLGAPTTTLEQWCQRRRAQLREEPVRG